MGANSAAGIQLATGKPIMAIGGFNGTDPAPTLAQFQQYVRDRKIQPIKTVQEFQELTDKADEIAVFVQSGEGVGRFVTLSKPKK